jgi:hypothetical protein
MGHVLGTGAQLEDGQKLGAGIDDQPKPLHLEMAAQPGSEFIELEVWEPQMAEGAFVQELRVRARTSQPSGDGGLTVTEDPPGFGWVEPFGQRSEHHRDMTGRSVHSVQGRVTSSAERGAASLTPERLDALGLAMFAVAHQSVLSSVSGAKVGALPVRTGEPFGVDAFGGSPSAFHLTPGTRLPPVLQPTR